MDVPCSLTQFREWLRDNSFYLHDRGLVYGLILGVDDACRSSRLELVVRRTREDMERSATQAESKADPGDGGSCSRGSDDRPMRIVRIVRIEPPLWSAWRVIDVGKPGERGIPKYHAAWVGGITSSVPDRSIHFSNPRADGNVHLPFPMPGQDGLWQQHQVGRFLSILEERLAQCAYLRPHRQPTG